MPWKKMRLRDSTVLARVDENGEPAAQNGRVEIRYNARSVRAYHAGARNLEAIEGAELLPDDHCPPAEPEDAKAPAASSAKKTAPAAGVARVPVATGTPPTEAQGDTIIAYADGACSGNPGPAGLGVVVIDGRKRTERSEYLGEATNNIAELTALKRVLEAIPDPSRRITIHTDSQYSIGVLSQGWKAKANQSLVAELRELLRVRPHVRLVYVRGHAGIALNERADELARLAVTSKKTTETVLDP